MLSCTDFILLLLLLHFLFVSLVRIEGQRIAPDLVIFLFEGVVYSIALGKERMIPSTTELGCSKLLEYNTIRTYVRTYEAVIECRVCRRMA